MLKVLHVVNESEGEWGTCGVLSEYYVFIFSTLIPSVQPFAGDRPVRHNIFH